MTHHHHHHHGWQHPRMDTEPREIVDTGVSEKDIQPNNHDDQPADSELSNIEKRETGQLDTAVSDLQSAESAAPEEVTQTVTAVVATAIDVIIESDSRTIAQVTVSALPAVVSVPSLGIITIPAESNALEAAAEAPETAGPNLQIPLVTSSTVTQPTSVDPSSTQSTQSSQSDSTSPTTSLPITTSSTQTQPSTYSSTSSTTLSSSTSSELSTTSTTSLLSSTKSSSTTSSGLSSSTISNSLQSTIGGTQFPSSTSTFSASSTAGSGSGTVSDSSAGSGSDTGKIVGGVVGGVLGLFLVLVLAFLLLRWRKKQTEATAAAAGGNGSRGLVQDDSGPLAGEMTSHRSSNTPLAAAAVLGRWASSSSSHRSGRQEEGFSGAGERGFQKLSGRKIPSVLHNGGDGYGDEIEEEPNPALRTPPLEATSPVSPISSVGGSTHRYPPMQDDFIGPGMGAGAFVIRPSPARTPTTSSVDLPNSLPQSSQLATNPFLDPVGRSLSRYDGSRSSRFTEGI